jgi:hypothetical protein
MALRGDFGWRVALHVAELESLPSPVGRQVHAELAIRPAQLLWKVVGETEAATQRILRIAQQREAEPTPSK